MKEIFKNAVDLLSDEDRKLPQIGQVSKGGALFFTPDYFLFRGYIECREKGTV